MKKFFVYNKLNLKKTSRDTQIILISKFIINLSFLFRIFIYYYNLFITEFVVDFDFDKRLALFFPLYILNHSYVHTYVAYSVHIMFIGSNQILLYLIYFLYRLVQAAIQSRALDSTLSD